MAKISKSTNSLFVPSLKSLERLLPTASRLDVVTYAAKLISLLTKMQESLTSVINLPDDDLALVERMIEALYSSTYDSTVSDAEQATYGCHGFELHAAMYAIADKYGLAELKHLAQHRYRALQLPTHEAKIAFLKSIARIYSTTPAHDQSLRKIALHWVKQKPFVGVDEEVKEFLRDVLEEVPDFNWELHLSWMGDR